MFIVLGELTVNGTPLGVPCSQLFHIAQSDSPFKWHVEYRHGAPKGVQGFYRLARAKNMPLMTG